MTEAYPAPFPASTICHGDVAPTGVCPGGTPVPHTLVRRVNQIYHDLTQDRFDAEHRCRHRVEQAFWTRVASEHLTSADQVATAPPTGRVVVDLACGTGFVTRSLARAMRNADRLIAIDVSAGALHTTARTFAADRGNRSASPQLRRLTGDGQRLPLASASVDLFAMNAGLHHVPEPSAALREIGRVLKPGGVFALGFEPNARHFRSPMRRLSRGVDRLAWYASPWQNLRRARRLLLECIGAARGYDAAGGHGVVGGHGVAVEHVTMDELNRSLMQAGVVDRPLSTDAMLDLVDPHARGARQDAGFDAAVLLAECFSGWQLLRLVTSDYLGEVPRRWPVLRGAVDVAFRLFLPSRGSLLSWVIRKPSGTAPCVASAAGGERR